jgi:hypothetical protein
MMRERVATVELSLISCWVWLTAGGEDLHELRVILERADTDRQIHDALDRLEKRL